MTSASQARPADGYMFDVFVSYRRTEPDCSWVHDTLIPALTSAGLRVCLDDQEFSVGAPLVMAMERAVEESRYTLAVITPAYLTSNHTQLETVLAQHLGVESAARRFIAIIREPATPALNIRASVVLSMTDDASFCKHISQLCDDLRRSP
jgi:hypothetical protein